MPMIFVTPAKGARVRMPERNSTVMAEEGAWVPENVHYVQLISSGDIVLADPQPAMPGADRTEPTRPVDVPARVPAASSKEK